MKVLLIFRDGSNNNIGRLMLTESLISFNQYYIRHLANIKRIVKMHIWHKFPITLNFQIMILNL